MNSRLQDDLKGVLQHLPQMLRVHPTRPGQTRQHNPVLERQIARMHASTQRLREFSQCIGH
jgi:hypothetical protein